MKFVMLRLKPLSAPTTQCAPTRSGLFNRPGMCSWPGTNLAGWRQWLCTGGVFGNLAVNVDRMAVRPGIQRAGVGACMLELYMDAGKENFITGYTRNPAALKMLAKLCGHGNVYPLSTGTYRGPGYGVT